MRSISVAKAVAFCWGVIALAIIVAPVRVQSDSSSNSSPSPSASPSPIPFNLAASPSPTPFNSAASPTPTSESKRNVLIVLSAGADASTAAKLLASMSNRLNGYSLANGAFVVAEPAWSVNDFINSCKSDPTVFGALIVTELSVASGGRDWFVYRRLSVQVAGQALWIACVTPGTPQTPPPSGDKTDKISYSTHCIRKTLRRLPSVVVTQKALNEACTLPTPSPPSPDSGKPVVTWVSPVAYSSNTIKPLELLPPLTLAFAGVAAYEQFLPQRTSQTVNTTVFPTSAPIPRTGEVGSIATTIGNVTNPGVNLGTLAAGLYTQSLNYTSSAFSVPDTDEQTWLAAEGVTSNLIRTMNCHTPSPTVPLTQQSAAASPPPIIAFNTTNYPQPAPSETHAPFCNKV